MLPVVWLLTEVPGPHDECMKNFGTVFLILSISTILAGCATAWTHIDRASLATSTASLAVDWTQTRSAAREGWSGGRTEGGIPAMAVMGTTPATHAVDAYFAGCAVANTVLWAVLPPKWRSVVPGFVIGVQAYTIRSNLAVTSGKWY